MPSVKPCVLALFVLVAGCISLSAKAQRTDIVIAPPESVAVPSGSTAVFVCVAYISLDAPLPSIIWRQEREQLNSIADPRVNISERLVNKNGSVFLKSVLQLCGVRDVDAANYSCTASNDSASFELRVTSRHVSVQIVITPDDRQLYVNSTVLFTCVAFGTPLPTITWSKGGSTLTDVTVRNDVVVKNRTKFVRSILQFCSTNATDSGQYTCTADNEITNATTEFQLTTQVPRPAEVVLLTENTLVSAGNTILLTCIGYGDPLPSLSWERVGHNILQNDRRTTIFESMTVRNGAKFARSILQICKVTAGEDTGVFSCTSGNALYNHTATVELTVHVPVQVVLSATDIQVNSGSTLFLTAFGYGAPLPVISWLRGGGNLTNSSQIKIFESVVTKRRIRFARSVLEICDVDHSASREYIISASNGITADMARFEISVRDAVQVVESPESLTIASGDTLVLSCVAYGVPVPSVSWSKNGSTLVNNTQTTILEELVAASDPNIAAYEHRVNRSGTTFIRSIIRVRSIRLIDSAYYSCSADNRFTNDTSSNFEVVVEAPVEILVSPGDTAANVRRTVLFSCIAYGFPLPTFTWRRNGSILRNSSSTIIYQSLTTKRGVSFVKSILEICSLRAEEDSGVYSCNADNMASAANASFELDVKVPVEIVISSGNVEVNPGQTVLLTCISQGTPLPSITWYGPNGGGNLSNETHPRVNVLESTETKRGITFLRSILQLCNINGVDSGDYNCFAENGLTNDTATIRLCAREPAGVVVHPKDTEVIAGSTVMLACIAFGEPLPSITWSAGGVNVTNDSRIELLEMQANRSGVAFVKSVLQICSSGAADAAQYMCTAVNIVNADRAGFTLTVISEPATLVVTPESIEILAGNSVTLTCVAFGYPIPTITWTKSDHIATTTLQHGSTVQILTRVISRNGTQLLHSTLFLCSSEVLSTAMYSCTAFNGVSGGASTSATATVNVKVLPTIEDGGGGTTSMQAGQTVSLVCTADGVPTPTISWFKDGCLLEVALNRRFHIAEAVVPGFQAHILQALRSTLTLPDLDEKDSGNYSCVASNEIDTVILTQPYELIVSRASINYCARFPCRNGGSCFNHQSSYTCDCPLGWNGVNCENRNPILSEASIVEGPQTTFVRLYQPASFTCAVSGNPQPGIMWYKDGSELVGERLPQLLIPEVHLTDRGAYHCIVFGREGNITSNTAFLNVRGISQYTATLILSSPTEDREETEPEASLPRLAFRAAGQMLNIRGDSNTTTIHCIEDLHFFGDILLTLLSDSNNLISAMVEEAASETLMQVGRELGVNAELVNLQRFDGCVEGTTIVVSASDQTTELDTFLEWSEAPIGAVVEVQCVCGISLPRTATRLCAGGFASGGQWDQPMHMECNFTDVVRELCLMPENDVVSDLTSLTNDLGSVGIHLATEIMTQRLKNVTGDAIESDHFFTAIDNILAAPQRELLASHEEFNTSGRLLVILEELADGYPATNETVIIKNMFATAIYPQINTTVFLGEGFSADLGNTFIFNRIDKENIGLSAFEDATASINLPSTLFNDLALSSTTSKLVFSFFLNDGLFVRRREYVQNNSLAAIKLGSIVIASHIAGGVHASSLRDPVRTTYITNPELHPAVHIECSYWDFSLDEGYGGWSPDGCTRVVRVEDDVGKVVCECDHLTNFAVLLDVTPTGIGALAYIGGVICIVFVLPTIVYLIVRSLQSSSTIEVHLINLCLALIGFYISFIISNYTATSSSITCAVFSAVFHYFFLVSSVAFTVVVFVRFRMFKGKERRIMFIVTLGFMWVLPVVIVVVSVLPDYTNYVSDEFCRPVKWPYWIGMLVISGILHLQSWCGLVVAPCLKRPMSRQSEIDRPSWLRETCGLISSLLFYDIAWAFGLPATHTIGRPYNLRSSFQGIFIVASAMLGFTIFLFFCALELQGRRKVRRERPSTTSPNIYQLFPKISPAKIDPVPKVDGFEPDKLEDDRFEPDKLEDDKFEPEKLEDDRFEPEEREVDGFADKNLKFEEEITEF